MIEDRLERPAPPPSRVETETHSPAMSILAILAAVACWVAIYAVYSFISSFFPG